MSIFLAFLRLWLCVVVLTVLLSAAAFFPHTTARAATHSSGPGLGLAYGDLNKSGKSSLAQNAAWVKLKVAGNIVRPGAIPNCPKSSPGGSGPGTMNPNCTIPSAYTLNASLSNNIEEPLALGTDDRGTNYTDTYMW